MDRYNHEKERVEEYLKAHPIWVLATSLNDIVSARSMSIISLGTSIYFQTDINFEKYSAIKQNPSVALCCGNYQLKGVAKDLGPTTMPSNMELMSRYKEIHPGSYDRYSSRPDSCLIKIDITSVKIWDYIEDEPYITTLDFEHETINKMIYK